jgi:chemotaxis protein MotA
MYNLFGFVIAIFFIRTALSYLGVSSELYMDEVAFLIVFGGTLAAMVISFPPQFLIRFFTAPLQILKSKRPNFIYGVEILIRVASDVKGKKNSLKTLLKDKKIDSFLREGIELYLLDLSKNEFKNIMTERIYRSRQREEEWVSLFRRLAKYPPAFGLVGTVLGLISLMRSVGEGANATQIGINMALALIATLYGLAFSNFILAPIAENFQKSAEENKIFRELLLEGLLMIYDEGTSLAVQEMLNSYLDPSKRVDILGVHQRESA